MLARGHFLIPAGYRRMDCRLSSPRVVAASHCALHCAGQGCGTAKCSFNHFGIVALIYVLGNFKYSCGMMGFRLN